MIEHVLLIDDSDADNFFHERAIRKSGLAREVGVRTDPEVALAELREGSLAPDLILLDINMPRMTGWEFLETYAPEGEPVVIVMLTHSPDPLERRRADAHPSVRGFVNKPLTTEGFGELVRAYFG